jgi:hypothetical protein
MQLGGIKVSGCHLVPVISPARISQSGPHSRWKVMAQAVAAEAIAALIAFLVSDATGPVSGTILPAYAA